MVILGDRCYAIVEALSFKDLLKIGKNEANLLFLSTLNNTFRGCKSSPYRYGSYKFGSLESNLKKIDRFYFM